jgi:acyl-CoA thioester hydrolase
MRKVYRHDFQVPPGAVDANGHVNNVEYVRWMQEAAVLHSEGAGCTRATKAEGATWVVRSHRIEYFRAAYAQDRVALLTWVTNFRGARSLRKYKFIRVDDNTVLAKGETDWVYVDSQTGRPQVIPNHVTDLFDLVPEDQEPEGLEPPIAPGQPL